MDCSVIYASNYPVLWMKLPSNCNKKSRQGGLEAYRNRTYIAETCTPIPLSSGPTLIIRDNRFSMRYDTASSTYTLQIKDVQRTDEATYQCQIIVGTQGFNKVTKHLTISVSQPPVISDNSTRSVVAQENARAELVCHAVGSPRPIISWRRENNQILPTGGIVYRGNKLTIHALKKEDRGTYYCVADNGIGRPARRSVAVDVEFPPVVETTAPLNAASRKHEIGQAFGYSAEIVCHIVAFPRPTITWVGPRGGQLSTNLNYVVDNGYEIGGERETTVRIKRLGRQQIGRYICRAQNKLGIEEKEIHVVETYEPNCAVGLCDHSASTASVHTTPVNVSFFLLMLLTWLFT